MVFERALLDLGASDIGFAGTAYTLESNFKRQVCVALQQWNSTVVV
jgi:hypothetical protein